jgi:hypothetical protein
MSPWYDIIKSGDPVFVSYTSDKWHGAFMGKAEVIDVYNITLRPEIGEAFIKTGFDCDVIVTSVNNEKSFYLTGIVSLHEDGITKISIKTTPVELTQHPPELHRFMLAGKLTILDSEETFDIAVRAIGINGAIGIVPENPSRLSKHKEKDIMMFMEVPVEQGIFQSLLRGKIEHVIKYRYMKNWSELYISFVLSELTTTSVQQIAATYNKPIKVDLTPKKGGILGRLLGG